MTKYNKASIAVIAGAIITIAAGFIAMSPEIQGAAQTIITALLVMVVGNAE